MKSEHLTRDRLIEMLLEDQKRYPEDKPILTRDEDDNLYACRGYALWRCRRFAGSGRGWQEDRYFEPGDKHESNYGPPVDVIIF